ncbi:glycogen debranching protein [Micromonospora sp. U56]|uniref:glucosylglycerate hydrolase n=1 Tax=Micromonospora sp. U56 TaxID=2824900 RepID=UPI001B35D8F0|nr:glycoside hydrolase 100 family protein [Micromonospora sp. U56]MBQ0893306.1 glycogen debranching protein [Micromonospora sp. U56]
MNDRSFVVDASTLDEAARRVLRDNDLGGMVKAAPALYPHQWSWDAAFISIGLAHMSVERALLELRNLFDAQWSTGMIPHIVFSDVPGYFPGPDVWGTTSARAKPGGVLTSGICQPPAHAIALARILDIARSRGGADAVRAEAFVTEHLPKIVAWHQWLTDVRDPSGRGLIEIHHGWESGMDNSPRWDSAYAGVTVDELVELRRHDTKVVTDLADRPSDEEYQRYLTLVGEMKSVGYDDKMIEKVVSFRVRDVFMTAVLALAADETARMADSLGRGDIADQQRLLAEHARQGVLSTLDPVTRRCRDFDEIRGTWIPAESVASWSVALCGGDETVRREQTAILAGPRWAEHPSLRFKVPPSVSPDDPGFKPRTYWRGPSWPFLNWLFVWALRRHGEDALAQRWREQTLAMVADRNFGEYYDPQTGEPAGSHAQSWTAAAIVDWLADPRTEQHAAPRPRPLRSDREPFTSRDRS